MLAVALMVGTFAHILEGSLCLLFVDNEGVRCAIRHGGGGGPETNMMVGHLWMYCACRKVGLFIARVETHANVADGPSRDDCSLMVRLGATEVVPCLPQWALHLWHPLV